MSRLNDFYTKFLGADLSEYTWLSKQILNDTNAKTVVQNRHTYLDLYRTVHGLQIQVSCFNNFFTPIPCNNVDLDSWLLTDRFQYPVTQIRQNPHSFEARKLKSQLPCITPSGLFKERCGSGLIQHSGMICIDIDRKDNPNILNWSEVKQAIIGIPGLHYAGLSIGGDGLFALFKIAYPERHQEHFRALEEDFRKIGLTVDTSCKDICRLRCASYDPRPVFYLLEDIEPYRRLKSRQKISGVKQRRFSSQTQLRVEHLITCIEALHLDITDVYRDWFSIGCALHNEFGELGRNYFHRVSCLSPKYDKKECDATYDKCARYSKIQIATFFHHCAKYNLKFKNHE